MTVRNNLFIKLILAGLVLGAGLAAWLFWPIQVTPRDFASLKGDVARGAYLARASGCFACHTNQKIKGAVLAGGGPLKTPFGVFYAPNITTHKQDGLGNWKLADFSRALTHGINRHGENYYPVFLYPNYTKLSDQNIADMWAAFQTVPPVEGKAPKHDLNFPFQYRFLLTAWKKLFFSAQAFKPNPKMSAEWNRGAFLVTGPAHCTTCHTPKNLLGGLKSDQLLNGDPNASAGEKIPAITVSALAKNKWTKRDIVFALKTGSKPNGDTFGSSMGEVVREGTRFLTDQDRSAIAVYLLSDKSD